ncbi:hypothetical protein GCM10009730_38010 [Streptomyces albidochromogenes]|uniref:hypothetical protein n=1 Tax=Streptomyces albidochromogenes TaxID=329524 RepID=UPI00110FDA35|nr:hypothetical protein [Streptomyces albidochromogenes]
MLEIRIICDPSDTDRVTKTLTAAFATGPVRQYATRDGDRARLYISADHFTDGEPEPEAWPTPEEAYALAPSVISEIGWTTNEAIGRPSFAWLDREFWLRKAAVLDRIALTDDAPCDAGEVAIEAARRVMELDAQADASDPRGYVRQQYAHWAKTK